MIVNIAQIK